MPRTANKADRLLQIESLLLSHPDGLQQAEIARRLGVNRSTIHRYPPDLAKRFAIVETDDGRLYINRDHYVTKVRLTLHEAMAVHLAIRLMATQNEQHNPHAASALRKLSNALERLAPAISQHIAAAADVMDETARQHDPVYLEVLETLARAWSERKKVRLWYQDDETYRIFEYKFATYLIEPYAAGETTCVVGRHEPPGTLRSLKVEKIRRIERLSEEYEIEADFNPRELLVDMWSNGCAEGERIEVVLRFHPRIVHRMLETHRDGLEQIEEQPDGSLIWRAQIAEPQSMLPWLRRWGADVEVILPSELRAAMIREARRLGQVYSR